MEAHYIATLMGLLPKTNVIVRTIDTGLAFPSPTSLTLNPPSLPPPPPPVLSQAELDLYLASFRQNP
jgi:hypothetical protein